MWSDLSSYDELISGLFLDWAIWGYANANARGDSMRVYPIRHNLVLFFTVSKRSSALLQKLKSMSPTLHKQSVSSRKSESTANVHSTNELCRTTDQSRFKKVRTPRKLAFYFFRALGGVCVRDRVAIFSIARSRTGLLFVSTFAMFELWANYEILLLPAAYWISLSSSLWSHIGTVNGSDLLTNWGGGIGHRQSRRIRMITIEVYEWPRSLVLALSFVQD